MHDLAAFQRLPATPYDACEKKTGRVSSLSLVRYRLNDYSVPTTYGHREVLVRGYVHEVVISCGAETIARHVRSYEREDFVFDPLHYLALLERKIGALDQAAPLAGWSLPDEFTTLRRLLARRQFARQGGAEGAIIACAVGQPVLTGAAWRGAELRGHHPQPALRRPAKTQAHGQGLNPP